MVLPASLTELFYKKLSFYSCTVSNFEQYTLARFMESGSFEKHINRLRNYYQNKRDAILEIFKTAPLDQYITIKEEDSGVHFMMKLKTERTEMDQYNNIMDFEDDWTDDELEDFMLQQEIKKREPYVKTEPEIGRNDPCPCGSGKKYKKCCGRNL